MANQTLNNLTLDSSPLDSDELIVKKVADNRAKKTTRGTLRSGLTPTSRNINTTNPLQGGGSLASDLTLTIMDASTSSKGAVQLATDGEVNSAKALKADDSRLNGVTVRKNSSSVGTRRQVNLIEGSNVTLTVVDDGTEIDVTIAATGGGGGGGGNSFTTISTPSGTSPVADSTSDTLTLAATAPVTITGNETTDTVTFAVSDATTSAKGVVELATDGETNAGVVVQGNDSRLSDTRPINVYKGGSLVGQRKNINFIEGSNVTITTADDAGNNRVNLTLAASGGGSSVDPLTQCVFSEDFIAGTQESGELGIVNFSIAGSGSVTQQKGEQNHPGIIRITSPATNGSSEIIYISNGVALEPFHHTSISKFKAVVRVNTITNVKLTIGFIQDISNNSFGQHAALFLLDTATSPNWYTHTEGSNVSTAQNTGVAVGSGTWYLLEARRSGSDWTFYINDVLKTTHNTNLPTDAMNFGAQVIPLENVAKNMDIDLLVFESATLTRY